MTANRNRTRARLLPLIAALAAVLVAAGCSSAAPGSSAGGGSADPATSAAPLGSLAPASDIGITATTIKVGVIDDVNTPVEPGLFQKSVNVMQAWATQVNNSGGLAGRKVVIDFCDSKEDPNATSSCIIKACQDDFALVGTSANALEDVSDIDGCKDATGKATGIPNLAAFDFLPLACDPDTFTSAGLGPYCATAKQNPQTFTVNVGDSRYYTSQFKSLNGVFVYDSDVPTLKIPFFPEFQQGINMGIKSDGNGFYPESAEAPQSALTPVVSAMKAAGADYAYAGGTPNNTVLLEREAKLQGLSGVKVWACNSGCYDPTFYQQGGSIVNGTYAQLLDLPYMTDYKSNPALDKLVTQLGGLPNINNNAVEAYIAALLFQDAVNKAVATGGTLTRASLFTALKDEHSFNADGIIGSTDIGNHMVSACDVITQLVNGNWQRVYPAKAGTFDCNPANLTTIKMNVTF